MPGARSKLPLVWTVLATVVVAVVVAFAMYGRRMPPSGGNAGGAGGAGGASHRPAPDTPRGVMWDLWHAAMKGDRDAVRAAFHATTQPEGEAADALADLLVAEAAFARQLQRTWPVSPTSRDGAGTWFGEGGDAAILLAREHVDPAAINATVNVQGTPVNLVRAAGAWRLATGDLVRVRLNIGDVDPGTVAVAPAKLQAMTKAYSDLTREVAALRLTSPSAAIEKLRRHVPSPTTRPAASA